MKDRGSHNAETNHSHKKFKIIPNTFGKISRLTLFCHFPTPFAFYQIIFQDKNLEQCGICIYIMHMQFRFQISILFLLFFYRTSSSVLVVL